MPTTTKRPPSASTVEVSKKVRVGHELYPPKGNDLTFLVLICADTREQAERLQAMTDTLLSAFGYNNPVNHTEFSGSYFSQSEFPRKAEKLEQALLALFGHHKGRTADLTEPQKAALEKFADLLREFRRQQEDKDREQTDAIRSLELKVERMQDKQERSNDKLDQVKDDLKDLREKTKYGKAKFWVMIGSVLITAILGLSPHKPTGDDPAVCSDPHVICVRMSDEATPCVACKISCNARSWSSMNINLHLDGSALCKGPWPWSFYRPVTRVNLSDFRL